MKKAKGRRLMAQINVVPYIDVMLVLLIIFMITAPLLQQGITVDLPQIDSEPIDANDLQQNEPLIVSLDAEGRIYTNLGAEPESPITLEQLEQTIRAVLNRNSGTRVVLNGDGDALNRHVLSVYAAMQQAGATQISVLTDPIDRSRI